jgi:hypothetical protein
VSIVDLHNNGDCDGGSSLLGCPICKAEEPGCETCGAPEGERHDPICPEATDPYAPDTNEEARGER